jgi:ABC-2 type transport system ATP-binding protein
MLTINRLTVVYGAKTILENLSAGFGEAQVHGLAGFNGSGKTTLLNTIYGFKRPVSGSIMYHGAPVRRTDMSFLETENRFYPNITGKEYLSLFKPGRTDSTDAWNRLFKLPLDRIIDGYSTGMKRKLAVMATLMQDKPVVILDEPFNGLDMEALRVLSMVISKLREKGRTVIVTSHILESLTGICDYIHYLNDRKIQFSRTKNDFDNIGSEVFRDMEAGYADAIDAIMF